MKRLVIVVAALALIVLGSFAGGVSAATLITGSQIKDGSLTGADVHDGSLTGADVKSASIPPGDLAIHPRTFRWTAFYSGDGSTLTAHLTSTQTLPTLTLVRAVAFSYSGSPCVRHGDAANPANNTGQVVVTVQPTGRTSVVTFSSASTGTNNFPVSESKILGNEVFTGSAAPHLQISASCIDFTGNTAATPMPTSTISVTFQLTAISVGSAAAFH